MEQLPLEISAAAEPTLDNYVAGANGEALTRVRELASGVALEPILYLWGAPASGCTHLLRAAARAATGTYFAPGEAPETDRPGLIACDEVEQLDARGQVALFVQINRARAGEARVLVAGRRAPAGLALRADLRTRLSWGLAYQLRPLSEEDKKNHLCADAARRGLKLSDEIFDYLLSRVPRDLASLSAVLAHLDRHALSRQRALTLPLVREALAQLSGRGSRTDSTG